MKSFFYLLDFGQRYEFKTLCKVCRSLLGWAHANIGKLDDGHVLRLEAPGPVS